MKKLMTVCAACLVAGMVSAQVESQNIVGYDTTATIGVGSYAMLGSSFIEVGGGDATLSSLLAFDPELGDNLLVWTGSGYVTYAYDNYFDLGTFTPMTGWYNTATSIGADPALPVGTGFWFKPAVAGRTLVASGEVADGSAGTLTVSAGAYNMISSPYPVDVLLSELTFGTLALGDNILVWTGSGYVTYAYDNYFDLGTFTPMTGWYNTTTSIGADPAFVAGTGFWYKPVSSTSITFPSPL